MGFGYLLIGYLVTFVLKLTAGALHLGALALFVGYGTMLLGLCELRKYCRSFTWAAGTLCPLGLLAVYRLLEELSTAFLWNLPFVNAKAGAFVGWAEFFLILVYHAVLLAAIREIALQVELKKIASAAVRNVVIVLFYGVLYVFCQLPISGFEKIQPYFILSLNLLNIGWVVCNLILLLSCTKNICAEGQEDLSPRKYRWNFLNKMGDVFERNFRNASDRSRRDVEDYLRNKEEKRQRKESDREQRKPHHKKKK